MRHETLTEEIRETAALYALHSLSQHEARAFELHLQDRCQVCEKELKECEKVVADLGIGVRELQPPDYLGDLAMARIEHARMGVPSVPHLEPQAGTVAGSKPSGIAVPPPSARRARGSIVPWAVAGIFAISAFLASYALRQVRQSAGEISERLAVAQEDNRRLRAEVESEKTRERGLAQFADSLNSPGARVIRLAGQTPAPASSGIVLWNTQENRWLIHANLPPAPQGKVYQLWFVTAAAKISAGLLQTDPSGRVLTAIDVPQDLNQLAAAAVTLEPEGGSPQPTMPIYLLGKIG